MTDIASVVLFAEQPERTVDFYRALGVDLRDEEHGDGLVHAATDVGDIHFAVFAGSTPSEGASWRSSASTFVGFYVPSLDRTGASLSALGAMVLLEHQVRPWGCRMVCSRTPTAER